MAELHRLFVERRPMGWRAECSCGFNGNFRVLHFRAAREADKHLKQEENNMPSAAAAGDSGLVNVHREPMGKWVKFSDHEAALQRERERIRKELLTAGLEAAEECYEREMGAPLGDPQLVEMLVEAALAAALPTEEEKDG